MTMDILFHVSILVSFCLCRYAVQRCARSLNCVLWMLTTPYSLNLFQSVYFTSSLSRSLSLSLSLALSLCFSLSLFPHLLQLNCVSSPQIADQLPWISLTTPLCFAWRWKHWSRSWPAQSVWSSLRIRCCCPVPTACASTVPTASWCPTAPPTSPWSPLALSSVLPVVMSSPSAIEA